MKIAFYRKNLWYLSAIVLVFVLAWVFMTDVDEPIAIISPYPDGKNFAFSITDDPDYTKLHKIKPVYNFFDKIGLKTTLAIWVKDAVRSNGLPDREGTFDYGQSCQDERYLAYIKELHEKGFEIALHTVSGGNDKRNVTIEGYEEFKRIFGQYPKINIMHAENLENIYWGNKVFNNSLAKWLLNLFSTKAQVPFSGEDPSSPYFWGDILQSKTKYVRLWGTDDINTLKFNPSMPYHDPRKPFVNYWFSFSDGYSPAIFKKMISEKNVERLGRERGTCIVYTHLVSGFTVKDEDGNRKLDQEFRERMLRLAGRKDGWFVPVSTILDRLLSIKNVLVTAEFDRLLVINTNPHDLEGLTLIVKPEASYRTEKNESYQANHEGEIIIDKIRANEVVSLYGDPSSNSQLYPPGGVGTWERYNMVFERAKLFIKHRIVRMGYGR